MFSGINYFVDAVVALTTTAFFNPYFLASSDTMRPNSCGRSSVVLGASEKDRERCVTENLA